MNIGLLVLPLHHRGQTPSLYTQTADIEAVGCLPQSLGDILVLVLNPVQLLEVANALFKLGAVTYRPLDALA